MTGRLTSEQEKLLMMFNSRRYEKEPEYRSAVDEAFEAYAFDFGELRWGPTRVTEIIALLSEVLPSDQFVVVSGPLFGIFVSGQASREAVLLDYLWYFWSTAAALRVRSSIQRHNERVELNERRHDSTPSETESLASAKWIVSIVTADMDGLDPSCPDRPETTD